MARARTAPQPPPEEPPAEAAAEPEEPEVVDGEATEVTDADDEHGEAMTAAPDDTPAEIASAQAQAIEEASASMEIERREAAPPANVLPSPHEWEATMAIARTIAATKFVPEAYRGEPESVVAGILAGREIGLGPMAALRQIHMIDGRPSFSAELMLSQMRKGGLVILESESTRERAYIKARRQDTGEIASVEWTYADAEQIVSRGKRLVEKDNWKNYPADMLWARCVGRLARRLGSDLLGGMVYAAEEMQDWDDGGYGSMGGAVSPGGYEATTVDLATTVLPGGPKGWAEITERMTGLDPTMPWAVWVEQAVKALVGTDGGVKKAPADRQSEIGVRIANAIVKLEEIRDGSEFPPPTRAQCIEAFAFAFDGALLAGPDVPLSPDEVGVYPRAAQEAGEAPTESQDAAVEAAAEESFTGPPEG